MSFKTSYNLIAWQLILTVWRHVIKIYNWFQNFCLLTLSRYQCPKVKSLWDGTVLTITFLFCISYHKSVLSTSRLADFFNFDFKIFYMWKPLQTINFFSWKITIDCAVTTIAESLWQQYLAQNVQYNTWH